MPSEELENDAIDAVVDAEEVDTQEEELEEVEEGQEQEQEETEEADEGGGDFVITIEGEKADPEEEQAAQAPEWVRDLRKSHRESQKRIRELEAQLKTREPESKAPVLGKKPSLDDYNYDTEKYESDLEKWYERKRQHDEAEARALRDKEDGEKEWRGKQQAFEEKAKKLNLPDFVEVKESVTDVLDVTQQGVIIHSADDPALVVYALGKNPSKLKELAAIKDPLLFTKAVTRLEDKIKMSKQRSAPPPPDRKVTGGARNAGSVDSTLERLRAKAAETGDFSEVVKYKAKKKGN